MPLIIDDGTFVSRRASLVGDKKSWTVLSQETMPPIGPFYVHKNVYFSSTEPSPA